MEPHKGAKMAMKVNRLVVEACSAVRRQMNLRDLMAFIEDGDFLEEFRRCGLTEEDREIIEMVITVCPDGGSVVPVTQSVRDLHCTFVDGRSVMIRYAYLKSNTVLLLAAYEGSEVYEMTEEESAEVEVYLSEQSDFFARKWTR